MFAANIASDHDSFASTMSRAAGAAARTAATHQAVLADRRDHHDGFALRPASDREAAGDRPTLDRDLEASRHLLRRLVRRPLFEALSAATVWPAQAGLKRFGENEERDR